MIGDFAILPEDGQDSMLIGILCGVSGGDGWCGRDRGSNVSRKKRPGGAIIIFGGSNSVLLRGVFKKIYYYGFAGTQKRYVSI